MTTTFQCKGCGYSLTVYAEPGFFQQPLHGRCFDCWEELDLGQMMNEALVDA